jgi:hypothetical protein
VKFWPASLAARFDTVTVMYRSIKRPDTLFRAYPAVKRKQLLPVLLPE